MFVSLYVCFLVLHRICMLDMLTSLCYCASLNACSDDHLLCYVIIVVISIWLFLVWSSCSCSYVSHYVYLIFTCYIILVILLLALPWGSNVFCVSVSSYGYICSKFITTPMIHDRGSDMIGGERERVLCYINYVFALLIVHDYA